MQPIKKYPFWYRWSMRQAITFIVAMLLAAAAFIWIVVYTWFVIDVEWWVDAVVGVPLSMAAAFLFMIARLFIAELF